jgi:serine/threonine protein kinase
VNAGVLADALPSYEIGGELGRGGWGVVLAGRHRRLGREVAIKQVAPAFAADPGVRRRFVEEARVLASVDHPHVVPVYDVVEHDGLCALVMELLPGGTLRDRMGAGPLGGPHAVALTLACTAGIEAAHRRGVLHRDVKPENMMFAGTGAVKVTDFGLAKAVEGSLTLATRAGEVLGTPAYIAPEQARGDPLSAETDVYALATMLYEMLSGTLPFRDDGNPLGLLFKHAFEAPVPLPEVAPYVPAVLAPVVMQGLATDPADRFASAAAFGRALTAAAGRAWGPGWLAAEPVPVMGAGAVVPGDGGTPSERPSAAPVTGARPISARVSPPVAAPVPPAAEVDRGGAAPEPPPPEDAPAEPGPPAARAGRPSLRPGLVAAVIVVVVLVVVLLGPLLFRTY